MRKNIRCGYILDENANTIKSKVSYLSRASERSKNTETLAICIGVDHPAFKYVQDLFQKYLDEKAKVNDDDEAEINSTQ